MFVYAPRETGWGGSTVPLFDRSASRVAAKRDVFSAALCVSALLCALVAVQSAADEIPVEEPADASLADADSADAKPVVEESSVDEPADDEPPAHQVGDVIATATRTDTPAAQIASSVTVVTAKEIERRQLRLVTDVLRRVPGVDVRRNGGPGTTTSIFVRGGNSDHVLVLLDGVELNDPSSPSRAPILNDLTTEDIERIEVVRGPQSVLYGGNAMSGVIQIFTKRGSGKLKVVGSGEGGSYDTARGVVSVSGTTEDLNYAASGSYWSTDGFSATTAGGERDGYENRTASARLGWKLNENFSLDSMFRYSDGQSDFDGSGFENDHHIDTEQLLARFAPKLSLFGGRWVQKLSGQFSRNERDTKSVPFLAAPPSTHTQIDSNLYALDWQNEVSVIKDHLLVTLGLEQEWEEADFELFDDTRDNFGVYLQNQFSFLERLFGTAGFRYDNSSDFDDEVTYRFTFGVSVPEIYTTFRTSYGTGYKAPSLSQLNAIAPGGNPNLKPEESRGADIGFETSLCDDRFIVGSTFFWNEVDDLIIGVFDPMTFTFLNFNIDKSEALGVETTVDVEIVKNLRFSGNYTYTHTEAKGNPAGFGIANGTRLLRRPTHKASMDLVWHFLDNRGELAANLLYVGDRRDLHPVNFSATTADDYVTLNLSGRFKFTEWLTVFARVDNVTDEDYEDVLGFATAGASVYGGIRVEY
jgi:vitamin B12 transporter